MREYPSAAHYPSAHTTRHQRVSALVAGPPPSPSSASPGSPPPIPRNPSPFPSLPPFSLVPWIHGSHRTPSFSPRLPFLSPPPGSTPPALISDPLPTNNSRVRVGITSLRFYFFLYHSFCIINCLIRGLLFVGACACFFAEW